MKVRGRKDDRPVPSSGVRVTTPRCRREPSSTVPALVRPDAWRTGGKMQVRGVADEHRVHGDHATEGHVGECVDRGRGAKRRG